MSQMQIQIQPNSPRIEMKLVQSVRAPIGDNHSTFRDTYTLR